MIDPYRFGTAVLDDPATMFGAGDTGGFWDFTDAATLYADTARTTLASVDGPALGVTDKSGKGYHLNGNATVRKVGYVQAGASHRLEIGSGLTVGSNIGFTAYIAFQASSVASDISLFGADISGARVAQALQVLASVSSRFHCISFFGGSSSFDQALSEVGAVAVANADTYAAVEVTTTSISLFKNGSNVGTLATALRVNSTFASGYLGVGVDLLGTGSTKFNHLPSGSRLYAALFINRPITAGERTGLNTWFANRAGL